MLETLSYTPVLKGFIVLILTGIAFPITGVYLLRMNLLPLRFMLMHGAILGGAISLAMEVNPFAGTLVINLLLVLLMTRMSRSLQTDPGQLSAFFMVVSISLAFIVIYRFQVPAKDTLSLMWGSLYTLNGFEFVGTLVFSVLLILFQAIFRHQLRAVFFDIDIARTSGVNEPGFYYAIILITAVTVAAAMKLIGALLLDALLLLPALIASYHAKSYKGMVLWASFWGGLFATAGFLLSLLFELPASSTIAVLASLVFLVLIIIRKK
ncbi:MAG: iron chelate uptake ABC transporter family permease subunit [Prolixibacteraceae bacterium]|jgi:zinc transport system permease protein